MQQRGHILPILLLLLTIIGILAFIFTTSHTQFPDFGRPRHPTPTPRPSPIPPISYVSTILGDSPIAYWRLGELTGTSAANLINESYIGTYNSSPLLDQSGALGGDDNTSIQFNGTSSYMSVPFSSLLNSSGPFTIEAWANPTDTSTIYRGVVSSRDYPDGWVFYQTPTNTWEFRINSGSGIIILSGGNAPLNTWSHLMATFDGTTAKFYVNGVQTAIATAPSYIPNSSSTLTIGQGADGTNYFFNGKVDEVSIYDKILTDTQISNHYITGISKIVPTTTPSDTPIITPTPITSGYPVPQAGPLNYYLYTRATEVTWPRMEPYIIEGSDRIWSGYNKASISQGVRALTVPDYPTLIKNLPESSISKYSAINLDGEYSDFNLGLTEASKIRDFIDNINATHANVPGFIPYQFIAFYHLDLINAHNDILKYPDIVMIGKEYWSPQEILGDGKKYSDLIKSYGKTPAILLGNYENSSDESKIKSINEIYADVLAIINDPTQNPPGLGLKIVGLYYNHDDDSLLLKLLQLTR